MCKLCFGKHSCLANITPLPVYVMFQCHRVKPSVQLSARPLHWNTPIVGAVPAIQKRGSTADICMVYIHVGLPCKHWLRLRVLLAEWSRMPLSQCTFVCDILIHGSVNHRLLRNNNSFVYISRQTAVLRWIDYLLVFISHFNTRWQTSSCSHMHMYNLLCQHYY
jgi:hypothetical protein